MNVFMYDESSDVTGDQVDTLRSMVKRLQMKECSVSDFSVERGNFDMETYIRQYKYLIGCTYCVNNKDYYLKKFDDFVLRYHDLNSVADLVLYLEDDTLVSYGEYMETYYPAYRHIWQEQL